MSIRNNILDNPTQLLITIFSMIEDEKKRMASSKLINNEQWSLFYGPIKDSIIKNAEQYRDWKIVINQLSNLHNLLKSIKLSGDFEKIAEEKFYIALDLPYEGEKFYDLSSLPKDKKECPECEKEEEEKKEKDEEEKEEDECEDCADDENVQDILADVVNKHLQKIANLLGNKGDHEAAYLVERTIRSISREAESGKLFGK